MKTETLNYSVKMDYVIAVLVVALNLGYLLDWPVVMGFTLFLIWLQIGVFAFLAWIFYLLTTKPIEVEKVPATLDNAHRFWIIIVVMAVALLYTGSHITLGGWVITIVTWWLLVQAVKKRLAAEGHTP